MLIPIFLPFVVAFVLVYCEDKPITSSAFLYTKTLPKQVAFNELGDYTGRTPDGVEYKKTYYISKYFESTWVHAKTICKAFELELATFETSEEASNFKKSPSVKNIFDAYDRYNVIVDGAVLTPKSLTEWYWTNSGTKIPYNMEWIEREPNYQSNYEYCLSIGKSKKNESVGFNDYRCWNHPTQFICQKIEKNTFKYV